MGRFGEVCCRRGLKVNADKSKVKLLNGEEGLVCEVNMRLEHMLKFNYLWCILDILGLVS